MPQLNSNEGSWCVYCHTNIVNGKKYIGITSKNPPELRWGNGEKYIGCNRFFNAINKYGWDSFEHEILFEGLCEEDAKQKEIALIKEYRTTDDRFGYNITAGGSGSLGRPTSEETKKKIGDANRGRKCTEEQKKKMSERMIGNKYLLGFHHSEETKRKISEASKGNQYMKGHHMSEETKKKMSESHKGYVPKPETIEKLRQINKGRKASEETKRKISQSKTGKTHVGTPHSAEAKKKMSESKKKLLEKEPWRKEKLANLNKIKVDMLDMDGNYIRTYDSATDAKRELGIDNSSIIKTCKGKMKSAGGYLWKYHKG